MTLRRCCSTQLTTVPTCVSAPWDGECSGVLPSDEASGCTPLNESSALTFNVSFHAMPCDPWKRTRELRSLVFKPRLSYRPQQAKNAATNGAARALTGPNHLQHSLAPGVWREVTKRALHAGTPVLKVMLNGRLRRCLLTEEASLPQAKRAPQSSHLATLRMG